MEPCDATTHCANMLCWFWPNIVPLPEYIATDLTIGQVYDAYRAVPFNDRRDMVWLLSVDIVAHIARMAGSVPSDGDGGLLLGHPYRIVPGRGVFTYEVSAMANA